MKRSLSHLPEHKRDELKQIVSAITENASVEMIILFGSFARGDWVEDVYTEGHITYEYKSDFDILVIVKNRLYARRVITWDKIKAAINRSKSIDTWTTLIVHSIAEVNNALSKGQYFFSDIRKEGVLLYDSKRFELARAQKLSPQERKQTAQQDFSYWFKSAREFYDDFKSNLEKRRYSKSAFELHQATERFYITILLVFTHYKPKEHNIDRLGKQINSLDPRFLPVFPRSTPEEKRMFELLQKAYIDARYNPKHKVTRKALEYLGARVKKLQRLTREICKERIESYG